MKEINPSGRSLFYGLGMECPGDSVPLRPLPTSPASRFAELVSVGPLPLYLSGGGQTPGHPIPRPESIRQHLLFLFKQIVIVIQSIIGSPGTPSRRRVHPRTRAGGGARQLQVICAANDAGDGGRGRSGARQRGAESSGMVFPDSRTHQYVKKKDDLQSI